MKESVEKEFQEIVVKEIERAKIQKRDNCSIKDFVANLDWKYISGRYILSEDFIGEAQDKVDWWNISKYQKLSEDFIREFKNKVNWNNISDNQKLSLGFIVEFKDNFCLGNIKYYQKITKKDIEEYELKQIKEQLEKTRVKNKFQLIRF